jgi:tetratricopeptide (TPR) repeat protein
MADASNPTLPSVDHVKPVEEGGPISRSGFKYQDEIAVGFLVEMLESPSIQRLHCETHDDVVLVRANEDSGRRQAEFVQVKAGELDKLWSVADLCARKNGKAGSSIFETSLARDKHAEEARFRVVTLRPVVEEIKLLTFPYGAPGRETNGERFKALREKLDHRFPGLKSPKGNGAAYWIENCFWDERHSEDSVRKDNLVRLWRLSAKEGRPLLPYAAEALLEELRVQAKAAGDAKWEPDRDRKIILRDALREWWDRRTLELGQDATTTEQPPLVIHQFPLNDMTRLHFAARRVPFVGRDAEMARLLDFMGDSRQFGWWIVTGSGGVGKSRLALECCLNLPTWRAGFLPHDHHMQSWHDWQPSRPTLILIDYAAGRPSEVRDIMAALASRATSLKYPVRVLLLERATQGRWWDVVLGAGTARLLTKSAMFADPLVLQPISRDAVWETVAYILRRAEHPLPTDRDSVLAPLEEIDPERRPLFAALAADALVANSDIRQWDRLQLLQHVLDREATLFWQPAGVTEADRNLLALATIAGGLPLATLEALPGGANTDSLPNPKNYLPDRYEVMSGQPATERLAPLEPDIIGEFFTLEHVKPRHALDRERASLLRHWAWRLRPEGAISFLSRAALDFRDHPSLGLLTSPASDDAGQRTAWSFLAGNLIGIYSSDNDTARARRVYDQLAALAKEHDTERPLVEALANGAFNLATAYGLNGDLQSAVEIHNALSDLSAMYLVVPEVRAAWAQSAANLIDDLARSGHLLEAEDLYDRLAMIGSADGAEPIIRESFAKGSVNLSVSYGEADSAEEVDRLYYVVANLSRSHPDEPVLRGSLVKAANNAVLFLGKAGKLNDARDVLRDLASIVDANPMEADLRAGLANVGLSFVTLAAQADDLESALEVREELRVRADSHTSEHQFRLTVAQSAAPLVARYGERGDFTNAAEICQQVGILARLPEPQPALLIAHTRAITALIIAQGAAGKFDDAEKTYDDLTEMTARDAGVREERARAGFNLVSYLSNAQQWQRAEKHYDDVERLADTFRSEPALSAQAAKAAFNLLEAFRQANKLDRAREVYLRLTELAQKHREYPEARHQLAKAAVNLCVNYIVAKPDVAEGIYQELDALAQIHAEDEEIRVYRNGCLLNLLYAYLGRNDVDGARALALSNAAILRGTDFREAMAATYGNEKAKQLFTAIDALLE